MLETTAGGLKRGARARIFEGEVVRHSEELVMLDHSLGDSGAELLNLFPNVQEECVTGPTAKEHDGEDRCTCEIHSHGATRADRMDADFV